jgi:hypothetical protein
MELSEAFYSGLSLVDTGTLQQASSDDEAFRELYATVVANFKSGSVQGNKTSMYNAINKTIQHQLCTMIWPRPCLLF